MGFDTSTDTVVRIVFWVGVGVAALGACMLAAVVALRLMLLVAEQRRKRFVDEWRPLFAAYTMGDEPPDLALRPAIRPADHVLFLNLWVYYHESLRGEAKDHLNTLAHNLGMDQAARRMLQHGSVQQRLLATTVTGLLRNSSAWGDLQAMVRLSNPYLSLAAARALLQIDAEQGIKTLAPLIGERLDWQPPRVASMLLEAGSAVITAPLSARIDPEKPESAARVIRYLAATRCDDALPAIRGALARTRDEAFLTACAHALGEFADPWDLPLVRQLAVHESAGVRCEAAAALGKMGGPADEQLLESLLADSHWSVRYSAAQSLAALPFVTEETLQAIGRRQPDEEGRQIVAELVAQRELSD